MAEPIERYRSFSGYLRERYGGKVWKISVDAGLSCPNRDGTIGRGGCIYCRPESFSRMQSRQDIELTEQIEVAIQSARARQGVDKFIIYFQSSSNTHAPAGHLRALYERALSFPGVVGLDIATRPDLLGGEVLTLLAEMAERTDLWIELGLQSSHDQTLLAINRGHTYGDYLTAIASLRDLPLRICTHLILGLPGEDAAMMWATADAIAASHVHEIKLHPLLILKDTVLAEWHRQGRVRELTLAEYTGLAADFIERMPAEMVMQRLTAEAPVEMLIAPRWALAKHRVRRMIEEELVRRNSWQGKAQKL